MTQNTHSSPMYSKKLNVTIFMQTTSEAPQEPTLRQPVALPFICLLLLNFTVPINNIQILYTIQGMKYLSYCSIVAMG